MIKTFYKKERVVKNFFDKNMKICSTAYGSEVAREFAEWRKYFNERWNNGSEDFLLSAQGGIDGNIARAAYPVSGIKECLSGVTQKTSSSVLPPLSIDGLFLEVGKDGFITVNSSVSSVNVGVEQKAWAIASVPSGNGVKNVLFVIAKLLGSSEQSLSAYGITPRGVEKGILASVKMENTLDAYSHIICMGRHVFAVHKSRLNYFYYIPDKNELERVDLSGTVEFVHKQIVADEGGRVYWISDNDVYGITIGFPSNHIHIECEEGKRIYSIQCTGENLLVYTADKRNACACLEYSGMFYGGMQKRIFSTEAESNIILGKRVAALQYIKIKRETRGIKAELVLNDGNSERVLSSHTLSNEKVFYIDGFLIGDAGYACLDKNNKIIAIK